VPGCGLNSPPAAFPSPHVFQAFPSPERETVGAPQVAGPVPLFAPNAAVNAPFEAPAMLSGGFVLRGPSIGSFTGFDHDPPSPDWLTQTVWSVSLSSSSAAKIELKVLPANVRAMSGESTVALLRIAVGSDAPGRQKT
jgi:hypothetical protein